MIGDPAAIVLAGMSAKGVHFDEAKGYAAARETAFGPAPGAIGGRGNIADYLKLGYVPDEDGGGSVSKTQEYAAADMALAGWAKRLGHDTDAKTLSDRARAAVDALWDPGVGFFRPKHADGTWATMPDPLAEYGPYTEGDAWQYLWMLPHQVDHLAELLGGKAAAVARLDHYFAESQQETPAFGIRSWYWHGNEPCMVDAWLYAAWGQPVKEAQTVDWILGTFYGTEPDGLAGNDDGGTMSAWLLFAMAGIYPVPGTATYWVGVPRVPKLVIHRPGGDLTIEATKGALKLGGAFYGASLDGKALTGQTVTAAQLAGTHTLKIDVEAGKL